MSGAVSGGADDQDRRPQLRGMLAATIGVALLAVLFAVVVDDADGVPAGGARATVDGISLVVHTDGSSSNLATGDIVNSGEEVRVESGTVVLELGNGAMLEGRQGDDGAAGTRVDVGRSPELVAGELLVHGDTPVTISAGGNTVDVVPVGDGSAATRLRRALSVTVGSYHGAAELDSAGQRRTVPALRQVSVAALGRPPATPSPLRLDATDPWDQRFLGAAFELTRQLDALSSTYTTNFGPSGASVEALEAVLPGLADEPSFGPELLARPSGLRSGGELLVGVAIALLGRTSDFAERFGAVGDFREDGAVWGLVALDQGVAEAPLLDMVEEAYGRAIESPAELASAPGGPGATTGTTGAGATTGSQPPGTGGTSSPSAPSDPSSSTLPATPTLPTTPTLPPPTTPTTPTLPLPPLPPPEGEGPLPDTGIPLLDDVVDPVDDLLGGILG